MSSFCKRLDQETGAGKGPGGAMSLRQKWPQKGLIRSAKKYYGRIGFRNSGARSLEGSINCDANSLVRHRTQAYFVP